MSQAGKAEVFEYSTDRLDTRLAGRAIAGAIPGVVRFVLFVGLALWDNEAKEGA